MAEQACLADPVPIFAGLGDRTRLSPLMMSSDGRTRSITMLAAVSGMTRQAVSKPLRVLPDVGPVKNIGQGRESRFVCRLAPLESARASLDRIGARWHDALLRLETFVEV